MERFDAVVIGAGQAGDPLAKALAKAGRHVALIERLHVGGTCANTGCTPTKAMIANARVAHVARRAAEFDVRGCGLVSVDFANVRDRAQKIVKDFREGGEKSLREAGVELLFGDASFTGPRDLCIAMNTGGERLLSAPQIFINVGASAAKPELEGLSETTHFDYASIQQIDSVPEHLLILGGGYIALEFGQMFRRFGSKVTIVESATQILGKEDPDVAQEMAGILRDEGIEIHVSAQAKSVHHEGAEIVLSVESKDGNQTALRSSHLLVAVGRTPNTKDLNPHAAGIELDEHDFVKTNSRLETSAPGVFAMGDCKGGPQFTHISYDDFRILRANLLENGSRTTDGRLVPYTVFTDPQLGRVGMTEAEARQDGRSVRIAKIPMTEVARTIETDETRGFMKAVVDAKTNKILGCAMLSADGGETMAVVQMAMQADMPYTALRDGVFAHPTLAESVNNLFMTLDQ